mmetsp:Transcript_137614/g.383829  ORF Transcript_137614/g.383829 Transcript_137614/m.383829 type:complete len:252 (-) Transcript_137614:26-781(-)
MADHPAPDGSGSGALLHARAPRALLLLPPRRRGGPVHNLAVAQFRLPGDGGGRGGGLLEMGGLVDAHTLPGHILCRCPLACCYHRRGWLHCHNCRSGIDLLPAGLRALVLDLGSGALCRPLRESDAADGPGRRGRVYGRSAGCLRSAPDPPLLNGTGASLDATWPPHRHQRPWHCIHSRLEILFTPDHGLVYGVSLPSLAGPDRYAPNAFWQAFRFCRLPRAANRLPELPREQPSPLRTLLVHALQGRLRG